MLERAEILELKKKKEPKRSFLGEKRGNRKKLGVCKATISKALKKGQVVEEWMKDDRKMCIALLSDLSSSFF